MATTCKSLAARPGYDVVGATCGLKRNEIKEVNSAMNSARPGDNTLRGAECSSPFVM